MSKKHVDGWSLRATWFQEDAVSDDVRELNRQVEAEFAALPPMHEVPPPKIRANRRERRGILPSFVPMAEGSRWQGCPAAPGGPGQLRISEPEVAPRGVYFHIHGGGWTLGSADEFDKQNQALARATGIVVASVAYRLAPEHRWPAAIDDVMAGLCHVAENAAALFGTDRIAVGGESAGAHLAAVALLRCPDRLRRKIRAAVLTYGCFDLRMTPSMRRWGNRRLVLSTPTVEWFARNLLEGAADPADPAVSPLLGNLAGMPPALFSVGTEDPLLDDSLFMAARWTAAGSPAELRVFPGGIHAFDLFDCALTREFHEVQAEFLVRRLTSSKGAASRQGESHAG